MDILVVHSVIKRENIQQVFFIIYFTEVCKKVKGFIIIIYFDLFKLFFSTQNDSLRTHEDVKEYFGELVKDENLDQV